MKKEELIEKIERLLKEGGIINDYVGLKVEVHQTRDLIFGISISRMYSSVCLQFKTLDAFSKLFETDQINVSQGGSYGGCETCDYGSSYEVIVQIIGSPLILDK